MYPHRIRLRGPWECEPLTAASGPTPAPRRMTMPCRWAEGGLAGFAGRVRFRRRFGYPGRIDDVERVWLTFAGVEGTAVVSLNATKLGEHTVAVFEHEVTTHLQPRNELVVEVDGPETGGLWGEVALEVRRTAYLSGVMRLGRQVFGAVVGTAERPLEVYAVVGRATAAYAVVEPSPGGRGFVLELEPTPEPAPIRVDLVDGGTIWYTVELGP